MAKKSEALRLLELLDIADLRRFAQHHQLLHTGDAPQVRRRLVSALGTHLENVVSLRGPWSRQNWNGLVQRLGGQPRATFEELRHELRRVLGTNGLGGNGGEHTQPPDAPPGDDGTSPAPPSGLPREGTVINGRYLISKQLGAGGFGTVFSARDQMVDDAEVVLKFANDPALAESVLNEYRKAATLHHPNICNYKHYDRSPEFGPFVVMENGGTSIQELAAKRGLGVTNALRILREAAIALDFAHSRDVIHGDVNPGNILVDAENHRVQLTDFGIATTAIRVENRSHATVVGTSVKGRHPLYGAPETFHLVLKRESDQYSLALVFCAMIKGVKQFQGPEVLPTLTKAQQTAFDKATSGAYASRFRSCVEFVDAMDQGAGHGSQPKAGARRRAQS